MPRRAGDSAAILDALSPVQRLALDEACEGLGLGGQWDQAPAVAGFFELVAYAALVAEIHAGGSTREHARDLAAIRLGLHPEAIDRRLRRQRDRSITTDKMSKVIG